MTRRYLHLAIAAALLCASRAPAQIGGIAVWNDPSGDAVLRRTDPGNNGPILSQTMLPDVVRMTLSRWQAFDPVNDPYAGTVVPAAQPAHLVRIDLVLKGVVNPPGSIGLAGPYNPFQYGPSPVYGFIELDLDQDTDTGGEFECSGAQFRHLANVGRFGRRPTGPVGTRAAVSRDGDYSSCVPAPPPFTELRPHGRSGGDWVLTFCGCFPVHLIQEVPVPPNDPNGIFQAGETWRVVSRFFQKIGGYKCSSGMSGGNNFSASAPFAYDPWVELRFKHSLLSNETTITLVYPLDMEGAAMLTGQPVQQMDFMFSWLPPQLIPLTPVNHHSLAEGLRDVILFAPSAPSVSQGCGTLMNRWSGDDPFAFLNPTLWHVRGILGTAYEFQEASFYAWTDTMFVETPGDMNADGLKNSADRVLIQQRIAQLDGGPFDCDGLVNGTVTICDFGPNFDLHDITGDGFIGPLDISFICPADFNGDGQLTTADFGAFQNAFVSGDPRADFNADGQLTASDFNAYQTAFVTGCP